MVQICDKCGQLELYWDACKFAECPVDNEILGRAGMNAAFPDESKPNCGPITERMIDEAARGMCCLEFECKRDSTSKCKAGKYRQKAIHALKRAFRDPGEVE